MGKHVFKKLLVDKKVIHIFANSKIPRDIIRKAAMYNHFDLVESTRTERKPYLEIEKTKSQKTKRKFY